MSNNTENQLEQFISERNGELTPQDAAKALDMMLYGDTTPAPTPAPQSVETGSPTPEATEAGKQGQEQQAAAPAPTPAPAPAEPELNAENAVLMAKDGKHTIPFEKLSQAREAEQHWKQQAQQAQQQALLAQQQLAQLQAEAAARAQAGQAPTKTDNNLATAQQAIEQGVDVSLFGDFSEEALAKGIKSMVEQQTAQLVAAQVKQALEPLQSKQQQDADAAHYSAIYAKHPDADSIAESKELQDWIAGQPSYARAAIQHVFKGGTTQEIIDVFDQFKASTSPAQQPAGNQQAVAAPTDLKAAAKAAVAQSQQQQAPVSLSDIPGGNAGAAATEHERIAAMSPHEQLSAMAGWSEDKINEFLNRLG